MRTRHTIRFSRLLAAGAFAASLLALLTACGGPGY